MKTPQRFEFRAENDGAVRVGAAHAVGARARAVAAHARLVLPVLRFCGRRPHVLELLDLRRHIHTRLRAMGRRPADRVRVLAAAVGVEGALRRGVAAGLRLVLGQPPPRLRRPQLGRVVREEAAARAVGAGVAVDAHARLVPAGVGSHSIFVVDGRGTRAAFAARRARPGRRLISGGSG